MAQKIKKMSKKCIAFICMITLVFTASVTVNKSDAALVTLAKLTLEDSRTTNATGEYTLAFTQSSAAAIKCVRVVFATTATGSTMPTDMITSTVANVDAGWTGLDHALWTETSATPGTIDWAYGTGETPASGIVVIVFDTITNPSTTATAYAQITTYSDSCGGTSVDTGVAAVAYLPAVTVSATVSETMTFTVAGVTNAACSTSFPTHDGPDTSATAITFGALAAVNTFYHGCQDLTVSTNATDGYTVTSQQDSSLLYGALTIDDTEGDNGTAAYNASDTWIEPIAHPGFGYACEDQGGETDCTMAAETTYMTVACTGVDGVCDPGSGVEAPQSIMTNSGPVDENKVRIEYKLTVDGVQESGEYDNTLMYIATPTF